MNEYTTIMYRRTHQQRFCVEYLSCLCFCCLIGTGTAAAAVVAAAAAAAVAAAAAAAAATATVAIAVFVRLCSVLLFKTNSINKILVSVIYI